MYLLQNLKMRVSHIQISPSVGDAAGQFFIRSLSMGAPETNTEGLPGGAAAFR